MSFYQSFKPVLLAYILSTGISIYLFVTKPEIFKNLSLIDFGTFLAVLLIVTGAMLGQIWLSINSEKRIKKDAEELSLSKNQNEHLLEKTTKQYQSLVNFSAILKENLKEMEEVSNEITRNFVDLETNATRQNEETNTILKEVNDSNKQINEVLSNSEQVYTVNKESLNLSVDSLSDMKSVEREVEEMTRFMSLTVNLSELLEKNGEDIQQAVHFINEISNKIKVLSLNASIEAARAGAAGKGFSVVAGEIQNLSQLTSQRVGLIENLLITMIAHVKGMQNQAEKDKDLVMDFSRSTQKLLKTIQTFHEHSEGTVASSERNYHLIESMEQSSQEIDKRTSNIALLAGKTSTTIKESNEYVEKQRNYLKNILKSYEEMNFK
jgi:methyl-accepting chemotaxis protein